MAKLIREKVGRSFGYEWTSMAYQEENASSSTSIIFILAIVVAFLITAQAISNSVQLVSRFDDEVAAGASSAAMRRTMPLAALQADREYHDLLDTACVYLLDCDSSVTRTAEMLFLHKKTKHFQNNRQPVFRHFPQLYICS